MRSVDQLPRRSLRAIWWHLAFPHHASTYPLPRWALTILKGSLRTLTLALAPGHIILTLAPVHVRPKGLVGLLKIPDGC